ncbi:MAG TPA: flagellar hook-associated protein FlgK [Bradyrhizobium sp.]|nr:flagellar hook-associated protein FlgK [Bradyrhizobium sp.]
MSLSIASSIAYSSLMTIETQMSVTSSNISNADTTGYTNKVANQVATVTAGVGTGTTISSISSNVDQLLLKSLVNATSELGEANTTNNYASELEELYGSTSSDSSSSDDGTSLASTLATLESAVSSLESADSSDTDLSSVVEALDNVASQLRETSSSIQELRSDADQGISSAVDEVNSALDDINSLNQQIVAAKAAGQSTADLEDQRNTDLQTIANDMNVSYFVNSSGAMQIYTASGTALLDSQVHALSYQSVGTVTSDTTYTAGSSSGFSAITVNGEDITSQITSGTIGALITQRDDTLPAAQSELDELAGNLIDALNAVSNEGTSSPPPSSLTGSVSVSSSDSFSGTGTVRIAVTDSSGDLVSYEDLDLSDYSTVGEVVSAINGISGLSASINSSGNLVISTTDSDDGVAINEMDSSVGSSDEGFSDYFGLNDLLTGSDATDIAVRSDILSDPSLIGTSQLSSSSSLTAGANVVSGGTAIADDLYTALTASTSFASAGGLGKVDTSFAEYAADIVANIAAASSTATSNYNTAETTQSSLSSTMSSESGVNVDQETALLSTLQNQYSAASEILSIINAMYNDLTTMVADSL